MRRLLLAAFLFAIPVACSAPPGSVPVASPAIEVHTDCPATPPPRVVDIREADPEGDRNQHDAARQTLIEAVGTPNTTIRLGPKDGIRVTTVCPGLMRTGSAGNALMKGRHEAEFAWFVALSSMPLVSINANRAARRIVNAGRRGIPHLTITPQARIASILDRLMPNTMGRLMAFANNLLPKAAGARGYQSLPGRDSRPASLPRLVTALGDRAARRNNELPA